MERIIKLKALLDKYDINDKVLAMLNIYQLRVLGLGGRIKGAVTLNRQELIDQIMLIKEGKHTPFFATSTKGRPSKAITDFQTTLHALEDYAKEYNLMNGIGNEDVVEQKVNVDLIQDNEDLEGKKAKSNNEVGQGVLEIMGDGYGFLRDASYYQSHDDIFVSANQIKTMRLRRGDFIVGKVGKKQAGSDFLIYINSINGQTVDEAFRRPDFEDLTPIYPEERFNLELQGENDLTLRTIDLLCPIGKGQRALVVAPPKAGKTTIIKKLAKAIHQNNKDCKLFVLLVDERPEEVTDIRNSVDAEVVDSTFDMGFERHTKVAELLLSSCKRLVETGQDVVILLDSITRLARAYNNSVVPSGRSLSGGLDVMALQAPKKFFGAARNLQGKGSLTIVATALVDTGSKMDDIIYEEFKGTGNMELHLDRALSERRIFPSVNFIKSGTRMEEKLLNPVELEAEYDIRNVLCQGHYIETTKGFLDVVKKTKTNEEFLSKLKTFLALAKR